jgi:ketosteroid isomerase-like protein
MSQEDVAIVESAMQAIRRGDWGTAIAIYDPAAVLDASRIPGGSSHEVGRDGIWAFYSGWFGAWRELDFDYEAVLDAGDRVVAVTRLTARGRDTGATVSIRGADVFTLRAGKVVLHVAYPDAGEALKAAGLEE